MGENEKTIEILTNATGTDTELLNIEVSPQVGDIVVKLGVFSKQDQNPETSRQSSTTSSNNLSSHFEVFQAILEQVTKTSNETKFLNILLHLLQIDSNEALCDDIWEVGQKFLHRATQIESSEDAKRLLRSADNHKFLCQQCSINKDKEEEDEEGNEREVREPTTSLTSTLSIIPDLIPDTKPTVIPTPGGLPPPPPPIGLPKIALPDTPKPSKKLKFFNWSKISPFLITKQNNCIWSKVTNIKGYQCNYPIIEELFYAQTFDKNSKDQVDSGNSNKPIQLLSNQLSLQIDIFLTQFKGYSPDDVAQMIRCGDSNIMDLDKLNDLKKILKKKDQLEILKDFKGERQRLARAEKFLISILDLSKYELRITCMVFKEEFIFNVNNFEGCMDAILKAGKDLLESESLPTILRIIMTIGNFLNYGGFMGNCTGFSIESLNSLSDTKANKTNMNLLHFIVQEIDKYNPNLKDFYKDFSYLTLVSKINLEKIEADIKGLEMARNSTQAEVDSCETPEDIRQQMTEFLQEAENKILDLKNKFENIEELRVELANYFCEDVKKFELKKCFEIFRTFCVQFREAIKENKERQELEARAEKRRKYEEEQKAKKKRKKSLDINSALIESEGNNTKNVINGTRNDEDLMAQLEKASEEELRKLGQSRNPKRPASQKFHFQDERTLRSTNLQDHNVETPANSEEQEKQNRYQKPWKRLLERYRANKCLSSEFTNRRPSLQIYIRSNSNVDNGNGLSKITPSSSASQITNKSDEVKQKFGQSKKLKSPLTIKIPKDTNEDRNVDYRRRSIAVLSRSRRRFSSINEDDLKRTLRNLRTPTIEGTNFCFSPVRDRNALNFMAFPPTLAKPNNRNIEALRNLENENNMKLNTASEEESKSNDSKISNISTTVTSESIETQILDSNPTEQENDKQFKIPPKPKLSQRIVTKLQNTFKVISRPTSHENLLDSRHRSVDILYHSPSRSECSEISKSSAEVLNKRTFSQRFAHRFRALSLLNMNYNEGASFQSYVDFKNDEKDNSSSELDVTKSLSDDSNRKDNEKMNNLTENSSEKVNKSNNCNQKRLSRLSLYSSRTSTSTLNTLNSRKSIASLNSSTKSGQQRSSLQNTRSPTDPKVLKQKTSAVEGRHKKSVSIISSTNYVKRGVSLPATLSSTSYSKLAENRIKIYISSSNKTKRTSTERNTIERTSSKPFKNTSNIQILRRTSLPQPKTSPNGANIENSNKDSLTTNRGNKVNPLLTRRVSLPLTRSSVTASKLSSNDVNIGKYTTSCKNSKSSPKHHLTPLNFKNPNDPNDERHKELVSRNSSTNTDKRRVCLPATLLSTTSSKLAENRTSINKSVSYKAKRKSSLTNTERITTEWTRLKPSMNSSNIHTLRRASMPQTKTSQNGKSKEHSKRDSLTSNRRNNVNPAYPKEERYKELISTYSSANSAKRRTSLPVTLKSTTSSKLAENRTSINKSASNKTKTKSSLTNTERTTTERTSLKPSKNSSNIHTLRRTSLPQSRTSQNGKSKEHSMKGFLEKNELAKRRMSLPATLLSTTSSKLPENRTSITKSANNKTKRKSSLTSTEGTTTERTSLKPSKNSSNIYTLRRTSLPQTMASQNAKSSNFCPNSKSSTKTESLASNQTLNTKTHILRRASLPLTRTSATASKLSKHRTSLDKSLSCNNTTNTIIHKSIKTPKRSSLASHITSLNTTTNSRRANMPINSSGNNSKQKRSSISSVNKITGKILSKLDSSNTILTNGRTNSFPKPENSNT